MSGRVSDRGLDHDGTILRERPTALLARETNGDLALVLPFWRAQIAGAVTDADRLALGRLDQ